MNRRNNKKSNHQNRGMGGNKERDSNRDQQRGNRENRDMKRGDQRGVKRTKRRNGDSWFSNIMRDI